eukprot:92812-Chlamydomonas_euryale.AAC.1
MERDDAHARARVSGAHSSDRAWGGRIRKRPFFGVMGGGSWKGMTEGMGGGSWKGMAEGRGGG